MLSGRLPSRMSLMLQKEAALRFAAKNSSGDYSPISIFLSAACDVGVPHKVSAACFFPRPGVDSMLLPLSRRESPRIFSRRRKQLGSIAKGLGGDSEAVFGWLGASGIDPRTRPEAVPLPLWELLDETVSEGEK